MRLALRVGLVLLLLLALAVGALVVALPRLASSDAVRARIAEAAREATGREVTFAALSFGLFPPRLVVTQPSVAGAAPGAPAALEAERIDLRLSLLPLLARAVVVDSVVLEGVRLRLVRTRDGIELPLARPTPAPQTGASTEGSAAGTTTGTGAADAEPAGGSGFGFAVGALELRGSAFVLEDRSVAPPVTWELTDVEGRARGRSLEDPIELELSGWLASGGRLELRGRAKLDGSADLELELAEVALAPAASYAGRQARIGAGAVSGKVQTSGDLSSPSAVTADLVVTDADLEVEDVAFQGRFTVEAKLAGSEAGLGGPFEIDATQARLRYGGFFEKPPGTEATATGRLVPAPGGLDVRDWHLKIRNFEAETQLRMGARTRLELDARPFDLGGWGELVPALAPYEPAGELALERVTVQTPPLDLGGRVLLRGLRLRPGAGDRVEPVTLDGALVAEGTRLQSSGLVAKAGGETVQLELELTDLAGAPRYRVRASTANAEIAALLGSLTGQKGTLEGPLTANADLAGPLGGEEDPLRAVTGRARIDVGKGRLAGVSLLRGVVDRLGAFAEVAALARGGKALEPFYRDEFESITGSFDLGGGLARTEDLRLVYRDYAVDLRGVYGLLDESLDFTGKLTVGRALDAALAGQAPAPGGADGSPAAPKVIPLARVRGTLDSPRVELTREAALALAGGLTSGPRRDRLERKIDDRLGEGRGKEVIDALEGLLGGREP